MSFEKDGFVAKKISFNTRVPAEAIANGFTPFDFAVSLFKQYDDINLVVFNQPVGVIRYESSVGDFDYDTDYTKSIQSQLQAVLAQVEKKQQEEAAAASEAAKRSAEEAREKAKADAEAQKQAAAQQAAQAKAEAEAKRQAEADARAEQARQETMRKEEEKRQAEARRLEEEQRRAQKAQAAQVAEVPKPIPPPAPVTNEKKAPPPAPRVQSSTLAAKPSEGQDTRRTAEPVMVEEASRMAPARVGHGEDTQPKEVTVGSSETVRNEELLVEPTKVTTVVCLETAGVKKEYRKVIHKWGATFYFKDGKACTQQIYEREALADQLAGAGPRGKLE